MRSVVGALGAQSSAEQQASDIGDVGREKQFSVVDVDNRLEAEPDREVPTEVTQHDVMVSLKGTIA